MISGRMLDSIFKFTLLNFKMYLKVSVIIFHHLKLFWSVVSLIFLIFFRKLFQFPNDLASETKYAKKVKVVNFLVGFSQIHLTLNGSCQKMNTILTNDYLIFQYSKMLISSNICLAQHVNFIFVLIFFTKISHYDCSHDDICHVL